MIPPRRLLYAALAAPCFLTAWGVAQAGSAHKSAPAPGVAPTTLAAPSHLEDFSDISCVDYALKRIGKPLDPVTLLTHPGLNQSGPRRLEALQSIVRERGVATASYEHLTAEQLARLQTSAILHMKGSRFSKTPDCYVYCEPDGNGGFTLTAPSKPARQVTPEQLATRWDGEALAVSNAPIAALRESSFGDRSGLGNILWAIAVVLIVLAWIVAWKRRSRGASPRQGVFMWGAAQSALIVVMATVAGVGLRLSFGMSAFPQPVVAASSDAIDQMDFFVEPPPAGTQPAVVREVDLDTAMRMLREGVLAVDARTPGEFRSGHIVGALNCPAEDVAHIRVHLAGIPLDQKLVVYCADAECPKGRYVTTMLMQHGFTDVQLYTAGWAKWTGPKEVGD